MAGGGGKRGDLRYCHLRPSSARPTSPRFIYVAASISGGLIFATCHARYLYERRVCPLLSLS